jgi:hypothetical protein
MREDEGKAKEKHEKKAGQEEKEIMNTQFNTRLKHVS